MSACALAVFSWQCFSAEPEQKDPKPQPVVAIPGLAAPDSLDNDPDIEFASRLERAFQKLARKVAPSVVSLNVHVRPGNWMDELRRMNEHFGGPAPDTFKGSGVLVESTGMIVTNEHVVRGADKIMVTLSDGRVFPAEVCGSDPRSDLAMIKLTGDDLPKNLPCAEMADSDQVEVGQYAMAVGNPFGLNNTFTVGVVSARKRNISEQRFPNEVFYGNLIQTDAAVNPGNSGGPLFNLRGKLIGINTMIFTKTGASQGFNFAIPANHLQKRLAYLKVGREIEYGWLGIRLEDLAPGQKTFKVPDNKGVLVNAVIPNTPADRAGLEQGMVILDFDGTRVSNSHDLMAVINETPVGHSAKVKAIDRLGKLVELSVRVSKRYASQVRAAVLGLEDDEATALDADPEQTPSRVGVPDARADKNTFLWRGLQVQEVAADAATKRPARLEVVRVRKGTPADRAGLYEGATLTELKHAGSDAIQKFSTLADFKRIVGTITGPVSLYVTLDGYVTVEEK